MDKLINSYFLRLSDKVKSFDETKAVYDLINSKQKLDLINVSNSIEMIKRNNKEIVFSQQSQTPNDFRIRQYSIMNFRKFQNLKGKPYFLDLTYENRISSLFLVGNNGSGKTSLFSGLEYMFKRDDISSANYRKIGDLDSFLPYGNGKKENIKIQLTFNEKLNEKYHVQTTPIYPSYNFKSFFCCEADLYEIQQNDDLSSVFLKNLGLNIVEDILEKLKKIMVSNHDKSISIVEFAKSYSYEMLQDDLLQILCDNTRDYAYELAIITSELSKFLLDAESNYSLEDIVSLIKKVNDVLKSKSKLKKISFFKSNEARLENYEKVLELAKSLPVDALFFYKTLLPINDFVKEMKEYLGQLSTVYTSKNVLQNKDKNKLRSSVIRKINELVERNTASQKLYVMQKNNVYASLSEENIEHIHLIIDEFTSLLKADKNTILEACEITILPVLNEFTKLGRNEKESVELEFINDKMGSPAKVCGYA